VRILIAGQTYHPSTNGQAVFTTNLAEALVCAGHDVLVIVPSERFHAYRQMRNGVCVQALLALRLAPAPADVHVALRPTGQVGCMLDAFQPDLVHIQDHYPLSRSMLRQSRRRGLPLVGTNHFLPENIIAQVRLFRHAPGVAGRVLWNTVLEVFNQLDSVTTPTRTAAAILREQRLRPPITAISCGVDLDRFHPDPAIDRASLRRRYGLDPRKILLLYLGRVDQDKGLDRLIWAFQRLGRADLQLAIAGKGLHLKALRALVEQLALGQRIVFPGYIPEADLPALFNSADIFVMPSAVELQSLATLEAMATGRPVLAANARALPEIVIPGVNGYLYCPDDFEDAARKIARLSDEPQRWSALGAASLAIASTHDLHHAARRYADLYTNLLRRSAARIR